MKCRVITVARSLGAGADEVAHAAAGALGFRCLDEEIIVRAAERAGVPQETVARVERTDPLFLRVLEYLARASVDPVAGAAMPPVWDPSLRQRGFEALISEVIRETAAEGKVVFLAHGAGMHLTGTDGLVRVFVTASPDTRAIRVARESGLTETGARKAIADSDRQRLEYLRRFCDVRHELPTHYDMVINTDVLTPVQAAEIIVGSAKGFGGR
ncbi:MAG: cytidylate kinase-like family protein [Dehalococcoidia bacterium]|nr:cytidylate kinase-like family protein [Dehalococcoidia bacterium]